jgi:hypothetical protein
MSLTSTTEQEDIKHITQDIRTIVDRIWLQSYMIFEIEYILSHLNLYKLQNLKKNIKLLISMLKKLNRQHITFCNTIDRKVKKYVSYEHHTFMSKMKTLVNLNVTELAHKPNNSKGVDTLTSLSWSVKKYHYDHKKK